MSPRQIVFLSSQSETLALSANEMRHFEGKPFEADMETMPFYGATLSEEAGLRASEAVSSARSADGIRLPKKTQQVLRSRSVSPPRRWTAHTAAHTVATTLNDNSGSSSSRQLGAQTSRATSPPAKKKHRPNALSFLDADSPVITRERISTVVAEASGWRPPHMDAHGGVAKADTPPILTTDNGNSGSNSRSSSTSSNTDSGNDGSVSSSSERGQESDCDSCTDASDNGDNGDERTPKPIFTSGLDLHMPNFSSLSLPMQPKMDYPRLQYQQHSKPPSQPPSQPLPNPHPVYPRAHSRTQSQTKAHLSAQQRKYRAYRYGTPEMPRGNANLPHLPPSALNPRVPTAASHVKHLPRAEKLPLTGYELLASQLSSHSSHIMKHRRGSMGAASARSTWSSGTGSSGSSGGSGSSSANDDGSMAASYNLPPAPTIKPLYRKFEALNHRILLHLQDELSELEEQLHRLDTADTQTRRLQNSILPASRRAEVLTGGELQWHKTDVLGKIGYKLGQYNHVLSSFTETQHLASPTLSDIRDYRTYLDTQQPIAEIETRFLDASEDLVTLARPSAQSLSPSSGMSSPASSASSSGGSYLLSHDAIRSIEHGHGHGHGHGQGVQTGPLFLRGTDNSNSPPSPSPSSLSEPSSTVSSAPPSFHSSQTTTAIFDKSEHEDEGKLKMDSPTLPYEVLSSLPLREKEAESENDKLDVDMDVDVVLPANVSSLASDNVLHLVIAMAVAVLVPVLAFTIIPSVAGRMAVVALVAFTVFGVQVQAGTVRVSTSTSSSSRDLLYCAAVYSAVMAVAAGLWNSVLVGVYGAAVFTGSSLFGWLADHARSRRGPLLLGYVSLACSTLLLHKGQTLALLVLGRILQGLSAAAVCSVGFAMLHDSVGGTGVGGALGWVAAALDAGGFLGPGVAGALYDAGGGEAPVFLFAYSFIAVDAALGVLVIMEDRVVAKAGGEDGKIETRDAVDDNRRTSLEGAVSDRSEESLMLKPIPWDTQYAPLITSPTAGEDVDETLPLGEKYVGAGANTADYRVGSFLQLLLLPRLLVAVSGCLVVGIFETAFDSVLPLFVQETFEWPIVGAGLIFLPFYLPSIALSPLCGCVADRVRNAPRLLAAAGFFLCGPSFLLLGCIDDNTASKQVMLCVLLTLIGVGTAFSGPPLLKEVGVVVEAAERASPSGVFGRRGAAAQAYGVHNAAFAVGNLLGPILAGALKATLGWAAMGYFFGLFSLVSGVSVLVYLEGYIGRVTWWPAPLPSTRTATRSATSSSGGPDAASGEEHTREP
ncbi:hypothetical protein SCUCBS95973_006656 [Sporothrix curviconia]|uniref:Major facilitator superfamily (MFS) profile domain-containing protein n=1 Tax=Sporothrix curviconia TaxID=1260050 RepID=A0ABP0C818_9PEZI